MKFKKLLLLLPLMMPLIACGGTSVPPELWPEFLESDVKDVKTAIQYLSSISNFTLDSFQGVEEDYTAYFHPDYTFSPTQNKGFVRKNGLIYPITIQNNAIKNKDQCEEVYLYDNESAGAAASFRSIDTTLIADGVMAFKTMKKAMVMPVLEMCGLTPNFYTKIDYLEFSIVDKIDTFAIKFCYQPIQIGSDEAIVYEYHLNDINATSDPQVEEYITKGQISSIDPKLIKVRDLFKADNYTQFSYDLYDGTFIEADYFHKDYFVRLFTDAILNTQPLLKGKQVLQLEIFEPDKTLDLLKDSKGNAIPLIYDDTYMFMYDGSYEQEGNMGIITRENPKRPGYAQGAYTEVIKSVEDAWNYPSHCLIFDNLDEFSLDEGGETYNTSSRYLIDDFLINFGLYGAFDNYGGISELAIDYVEEDNEVFIDLLAAQGGYYEIHFGEFGTTAFKPFDDLLASL